MAFDVKAATPDASFPSGAVLFGADSQAAASPSVYAQSTVWDYWKTLANTWSAAGGASAPAAYYTGAIYAAGTGTTNFPHIFVQPTGATASAAWSTAGTVYGANLPTGFAGNFIDLQLAGVSKVYIDTVSNGGRINITTVTGSATYRYEPRDGFMGGFYNSAGIWSWSSAGIHLNSSYYVGFGEINAPSDVRLYGPSANVLELRNSTSSQTQNFYDTYASSTDYHRVAIKTARATLASVSGATVTATGIIPDGAVVVGVTTKVTVALGTGGGTSGYNVGDGSDPDRWGAITGTVAGTSSDNTNWTAGTIQAFTAASDIVITAVGGNFNGTGTIYVSVQYLIGQCD